MKRLALLVGLLMSAGCISTAPPEAIAPVQSTPLRAASALPPITPEQITDTNGHQVAQALDEEINREAQQNVLGAAPR